MAKTHHLKGNKKKLIPIALLLIIACVIAYFALIKENVYVGQVEAQILHHVAEVSGKIVESDIELGQNVKAGDLLAAIDSADYGYALEQLELSLQKAVLAASDVQKSGKSQTQNAIAAAQAAANAAASAANKAAADYERAQELYEGEAISKEALDGARLQHETAQSALSAAQAQVALAGGGTAAESLSIDIALLESKIKQQKELIEKCEIRAAADGTVMSKNYGRGDIVSLGYNIADISSEAEKYLVIYYPREGLHDLSYGQEVKIDYRGEIFTGIIKFIDVKPQYTPQDMQTAANKNKEAMKVKILLPEGMPIKPGEEAKVMEFAAQR